MICSITEKLIDEPVVSKFGHVYEKRAIENFIEQNGKCPVTGEPLALDELVAIKINKIAKPRSTASGTSIPSMLQTFQNEWDALMLQTYTLKQQLESTRQELAQTLYQYDAACRVIARIIKERDEARSALANAKVNINVANGGEKKNEAMEVEQAQDLSPAVLDKVQEAAKSLSTARKQRVISPSLASQEQIGNYKLNASHTGLHSSASPGILTLDINPRNSSLLLTGGVDKSVVLFNTSTGKELANLKGHSKKVLDVLFHPTKNILLSTSQDKTAIVWGAEEHGYKQVHRISSHSDDVTEVSAHPCGDYFALSSLDKTWSFNDLETGTALSVYVDASVQGGAKCGTFHPDGLLYASGYVDSVVRVWDIKTKQSVASFQGHHGTVGTLSFSENGFYLLSGAEDGSIKLWDLRKLKNVNTYTFEESQPSVSSIIFDHSGNYFVATGPTVKVFCTKPFSPIATFKDHASVVTDAKFGQDSTFIASTSMDRTLKIYSK